MAAIRSYLRKANSEVKLKSTAVGLFYERQVDAMNHTKAIMFSLLAFFAIAAVVKADTAPPMVTVYVTYNGNPINGTFYSIILSCMNSSNVYTSRIPIQQLNISEYDAAKGCYWEYYNRVWGGECADGICSFEYFPLYDFKMAFYLPSLNKTFITNEINISNFTTSYSAQLYPDGSATISGIYNTGNIAGDIYSFFAMALVLTLVIEITVAFLYLYVVKIKKKVRILLTAALANIISVPVVWFGFVFLLGGLGLLLGEIFAVVFEGYLIYYFNKKKIKLKKAMLMSIIMNLASVVIGGLALLFL